VSEDPITSERTDEAKRGITIGILIVALLCLSLFFVWRHYGIAGSADRTSTSDTR
jgi:hypothetical protein